MKKLFAALALIPSLALADEPSKWTTFTKMPDGQVWEYKNGSFDIIKGEGQPYWIVQWRTHQDGKPTYNFVKIAVGLQSCAKESGQIMMVDMENNVQAKIDFVFEGGTLASNIAEVTCAVGKKILEKMPKQDSEEPNPVST
jgi:hypothetical protein